MKPRNIALDLYRILCMFLITTIHIVTYSDLITAIPEHHLNFWLVNGLQVLQMFSISGFTLISAYYLVDKPFRIRRILRFALSVVFFSAVIYLLSLIFVKPDFSVLLVAKSFFPLITYHYWYPVHYLILLALSPFLNRLIRSLSRKELLAGIGILVLISGVYFPLSPFTESTVLVGHHTRNLVLFILLYGVAGYIKLYGVRFPRLMGVGLFCASGFLLFVLNGIKNNAFGLLEAYPVIAKVFEKLDLLSYNSVLPFMFTASSFVLFTQIKATPPQWLSKAVSFSVPAVFVIYLFQEHNAVRGPLWELVGITDWADSYLLLPVMLVCFAALFAVALGIHMLYRLCDKWLLSKAEKLLEKPLMKIAGKH